MTVEETERPKDTAATGQILATMDSEQLLQSKQKDPALIYRRRKCDGKRTPRKRTMVCNIFPPSMNTNFPCQDQA
jgi:hypothetical protein